MKSIRLETDSGMVITFHTNGPLCLITVLTTDGNTYELLPASFERILKEAGKGVNP